MSSEAFGLVWTQSGFSPPVLEKFSLPICVQSCRWSCTSFAYLGKKSWDAPMTIKGFVICRVPRLCTWGVEDMRSPQWLPVQSPASFQQTDVVMRKGWKGHAWVISWIYLIWGNSWDSLKWPFPFSGPCQGLQTASSIQEPGTSHPEQWWWVVHSPVFRHYCLLAEQGDYPYLWNEWSKDHIFHTEP